MHLLDRLFWWAARALPAAPSVAWLDAVVRSEDPFIGPSWPVRHAAAHGLSLEETPARGLIPDLSRLDGPTFSSERVPVTVRRFYEQTGTFDIEVDADWHLVFRWMAWWWNLAYSRRWGQLELPADASTPLTNEIYTVTVDRGPFWVRRYRGTERALYVSRYDVVAVPGEAAPHVRIAFPVPGGAWVVLFRAVQLPDGLLLTEAGGSAGGPGLYLLPATGPARYAAALREAIAVRETGAGLAATHHFHLWGIRFLTLRYTASLQR